MYAFQHYDPDRMARATRRDESVSFKQSIELAGSLRGMRSDRAERYLEAVIAKRQPVPYTRFTNGAGHKRGPMAAGKYPIKTATAFLQLLKQGLANAENKGLGSPLQLVSIMAQPASTPVKYGRQRGRQGKRCHLELVLRETEESKRAAKPKKGKPAVPKAVSRPEAESAEQPAEKAPAKKTAAKPEQKEPPKADKPAVKTAPDKAPGSESKPTKKPDVKQDGD